MANKTALRQIPKVWEHGLVGRAFIISNDETIEELDGEWEEVFQQREDAQAESPQKG